MPDHEGKKNPDSQAFANTGGFVPSEEAEKNNTDAEKPTNDQEHQGNDRFDPSRLRLSQNFAQSVGVRKLLNTVPVRKPNRQEFIRVHPNKDYWLETAVLELREEREIYLVSPDLWQELSSEITPKLLCTTINRQRVLTLWPIRMPGEDGRLDQWNTSAMAAADLACDHWVKVVANMSLGAYEVYPALGDLLDPEWPDLSLHEILKIAFKGNYIADLDHPVIRRLRGEV